MQSLCNGWEFTERWSEEFCAGIGEAVSVRLPHTVREAPLHGASPADYEMLCGYRRTLFVPGALRGKRLFLQFDGAAHIATVYVNQKELTTHRCGYTAFRVEITDAVDYDAANRIAVRLDCTENASVPPFGFVIDYLTYGGLYREVWLDVRGQTYLSDLFLSTPELTQLRAEASIEGHYAALRFRVRDAEGALVAEAVSAYRTALLEVPEAKPWSPDSPALYTCEAAVLDENGQVLDRKTDTFGFRTVQARADGIYLNGTRLFLRGLNRHQCYPYIGYAAPESLQREDARILKRELACNVVRTSHYPQSQYFIDECDRLGLTVVTEIPGWQHIGGTDWQRQACENTREMVLQYRNHPSILLWGVRINESQDNDDFYTQTNAIARALDPTRPTTGVRFLEKSSLLEDVYAFNDFSHSGKNAGVRPKSAVTPDVKKPLLITEHNGHMFPTKSFDTWEKRQEHALRHARVLNDAAADGQHAGCIGWCMFDYPTHRDFGSGDRVCYHGVMDAFRNPKPAAALYASQGEERPVLEVCSPMDIGDYPAGHIGTVWVFTNADTVELYKNDQFVAALRPQGWAGLAHGPIAVDDFIGKLLETQEGFSGADAKLLRECLLAAAKYGLSGMPLQYKLRMAQAMLRCHLRIGDGVALYGKYVSNWGGKAIVWRFDAKRGDEVVASVTRASGCRLHLELTASRTALCEGDTYDMAAVRIRVLDEYGTLASYAQLPVRFRVSGSAELVGPELAVLEGGMGGTYLRTAGRSGAAQLTVESPQTEPVTLEFTVQMQQNQEEFV